MASTLCAVSLSLIFGFSVTIASCSKILNVPLESAPGSIFSFSSKISQDLAEKGHDVTLLVSSTYHSDILKSTNVSGFDLEIYQSNMDKLTEYTPNLALSDTFGWYNLMFKILYLLSWDCDEMFADNAVLKRLKDSNFDLVVSHAGTPCQALLAHYLDKPFVLVSGVRVIPEFDAFMYNIPNNLAYVPCMGTGLIDKMSFFDRVYNAVDFVMKYIAYNMLLAVYGQVKYKHNIKPDLSIRDVFVDAELFLFNTDMTLHTPRPFMPNVISLGGGYQTKPVKPLQRELEDFVQSSGEDGIVVLSFGSYVVIDDEDQFRKFAMGLNKFPQKIVARYGGDKPPGYLDMDKFKLMKWIPQNDLLGHPKTKAFVYHGGLNGLYEAINYAVPIVGIPLFADQYDNVKVITDKGMGLALDIKTMTSEDLYNAVTKVMNEPRFKENAVRLSAIHRDQHMSPKDTMVYWIEYAIKHGGKHLQSQAVNLNFFQYHLIDVYVFIICVIVVAAYIISMTCSFICTRVCKRQKEKLN
ncbi:UDP-glucuronosyltransferase 2B15-like [Glandiceps talaboti]